MLWVSCTHGVVVDVAIYGNHRFACGLQGIHTFVRSYIPGMPDHINLATKFKHTVVHVTVIVREQQDFLSFFSCTSVPLAYQRVPKVMRTLLRLAFDGAPFCGWQIQPSDRTAQGDLDDALSKLLNQPISSMGAGRTDTGVHAKEMYVHFDWKPELATNVKDLDHLVHRLNRFLDPAIRVFEAREVASDWHARFDAVSRSYEYYMCDNGSPFHRDAAWMVDKMPDVAQMNAAAALLLQEEDFASFCKSGSDNKTTLCNVTEARWVQHGDLWIFHITADRFLRNMVRAIVGSLYEVGRGKWTVEDFQSRLHQKIVVQWEPVPPLMAYIYLT